MAGALSLHKNALFLAVAVVGIITATQVQRFALQGSITGPNVCGNGHVNRDNNEQCDDNNTNGGDGCDASCRVQAGFECSINKVYCDNDEIFGIDFNDYPHSPQYIEAMPIDSNKVAIFYSVFQKVYVRIGTVDHNDHDVWYAPPVELISSTSSNIVEFSVSKMSSSTFVVAYDLQSGGGEIVRVTVSGNSATAGTRHSVCDVKGVYAVNSSSIRYACPGQYISATLSASSLTTTNTLTDSDLSSMISARIGKGSSRETLVIDTGSETLVFGVQGTLVGPHSLGRTRGYDLVASGNHAYIAYADYSRNVKVRQLSIGNFIQHVATKDIDTSSTYPALAMHGTSPKFLTVGYVRGSYAQAATFKFSGSSLRDPVAKTQLLMATAGHKQMSIAPVDSQFAIAAYGNRDNPKDLRAQLIEMSCRSFCTAIDLCNNDGRRDSTEACDDGNTINGDGCDQNCAVQTGYTCTDVLNQLSVCTRDCGNGQIQDAEECDDNNTTNGDGCSNGCVIETDCLCTGEPSVCTCPGCGDSIRHNGEECDDGNTTSGDGCSSQCVVENGYQCPPQANACGFTFMPEDRFVKDPYVMPGPTARTVNVALDTERVLSLVAYNGTAGIYAQVNSVANEGGIAPGNRATVHGSGLAALDKLVAVKLDNNKVIAMWTDTNGNSEYSILTISGQNVTVGTVRAFTEASCDMRDIAVFTPSKVAVACMRDGSHAIYVGTVSGNTITLGAAQGASLGTVTEMELVTLGPSRVVLVYDDARISGIAAERSGDTLTYGSARVMNDQGDSFVLHDLEALSAERILAVYTATTGVQSDYPHAIIARVQNNSITTVGSRVNLVHSPATAMDAAVMPGDYPVAAITWLETSGTVRGIAKFYMTSGAENTVAFMSTYGDQFIHTGGSSGPLGPQSIAATALQSNKVIVNLEDTTNLEKVSQIPIIVDCRDQCSLIPSPPVCGDGAIEGTESCDDNNTTNGDGCDNQCEIEDGWICTGEPSDCNPICGDGKIRGSEECDDNNTTNGDGCNNQCEVEDGCTCNGEPSSCSCPTAECGNGLREEGEGCDDDNTTNGDGCSSTCAVETGWQCKAENGTCVNDDIHLWPFIDLPVDTKFVRSVNVDSNRTAVVYATNTAVYSRMVTINHSTGTTEYGPEHVIQSGGVGSIVSLSVSYAKVREFLVAYDVSNGGGYVKPVEALGADSFKNSSARQVCDIKALLVDSVTNGNYRITYVCPGKFMQGNLVTGALNITTDESIVNMNFMQKAEIVNVNGYHFIVYTRSNPDTMWAMSYGTGPSNASQIGSTHQFSIDAHGSFGYVVDSWSNGALRVQRFQVGDTVVPLDTRTVAHGTSDPSMAIHGSNPTFMTIGYFKDGKAHVGGMQLSGTDLTDDFVTKEMETATAGDRHMSVVAVDGAHAHLSYKNAEASPELRNRLIEYVCRSQCSAVCGDGLIRDDEECDDGNTDNGDGCNMWCDVETGCTCNGEPSVCNCPVASSSASSSSSIETEPQCSGLPPQPDFESTITACEAYCKGDQEGDICCPILPWATAGGTQCACWDGSVQDFLPENTTLQPVARDQLNEFKAACDASCGAQSGMVFCDYNCGDSDMCSCQCGDPVCNHNFVCEAGEDRLSCPLDCFLSDYCTDPNLTFQCTARDIEPQCSGLPPQPDFESTITACEAYCKGDQEGDICCPILPWATAGGTQCACWDGSVQDFLPENTTLQPVARDQLNEFKAACDASCGAQSGMVFCDYNCGDSDMCSCQCGDPVCNHNFVCEAGEDRLSCPLDCFLSDYCTDPNLTFQCTARDIEPQCSGLPPQPDFESTITACEAYCKGDQEGDICCPILPWATAGGTQCACWDGSVQDFLPENTTLQPVARDQLNEFKAACDASCGAQSGMVFCDYNCGDSDMCSCQCGDPVCNHNFVCEAGEDRLSCPLDCFLSDYCTDPNLTFQCTTGDDVEGSSSSISTSTISSSTSTSTSTTSTPIDNSSSSSSAASSIVSACTVIPQVTQTLEEIINECETYCKGDQEGDVCCPIIPWVTAEGIQCACWDGDISTAVGLELNLQPVPRDQLDEFDAQCKAYCQGNNLPGGLTLCNYGCDGFDYCDCQCGEENCNHNYVCDPGETRLSCPLDCFLENYCVDPEISFQCTVDSGDGGGNSSSSSSSSSFSSSSSSSQEPVCAILEDPVDGYDLESVVNDCEAQCRGSLSGDTCCQIIPWATAQGTQCACLDSSVTEIPGLELSLRPIARDQLNEFKDWCDNTCGDQGQGGLVFCDYGCGGEDMCDCKCSDEPCNQNFTCDAGETPLGCPLDCFFDDECVEPQNHSCQPGDQPETESSSSTSTSTSTDSSDSTSDGGTSSIDTSGASSATSQGPVHTECRDRQCVLVAGAGRDLCFKQQDCENDSHLECNDQKQCIQVDTPGASFCGDDIDCETTQKTCDVVLQQCLQRDTFGFDLCSVDDNCENAHLECRNSQCTVIGGPGVNTCNHPDNCVGGSSSTTSASTDSSASTSDGTTSSTDNSGASSTTSGGPVHTECVDSQCVLVNGAGPDKCFGEQDCADPFHTECNDSKQCIQVDTPGASTCFTDTDCETTQKTCDVVLQQCLQRDTFGFDLCSVDDNCENAHLECRNSQCTVVGGPGTNTCSRPEDCTGGSSSTTTTIASASSTDGTSTSTTVSDDGSSTSESDTSTSIALVDYCCSNNTCLIVGDGDQCDNPYQSFAACSVACGVSTSTSTSTTNSTPTGTSASSTTTSIATQDIEYCCVTGTCQALAQGSCNTPYETLTACRVFCGDSNSAASATSTITTFPYCGDGTRDEDRLETCDDGNNSNGDGCDENCQIEGVPPDLWCGDGRISSLEECDDGNRLNGDGCDSRCKIENPTPPGASCGNSVIETFEMCDDGNTNDGDGCSRFCLVEQQPPYTPFCGDGIRQTQEQCDDGNTNDADGCSSDCFVEDFVYEPGQYCGDGSTEGQEECDDGNLIGGDGCSAFCTFEGDTIEIPPGARCGDGNITFPEDCDDGNLQDGDGCSSFCLTEVADPVCGDGVQHVTEQCDDGNITEYDGCSSDCFISARIPLLCGDGILTGNEECDNGGLNSNGLPNACRLNCNLPRCGDAVVDTGMGEECDEGLKNGKGLCTADCTIPLCGNGVLDEGEQCDDGNRVSGDGCSDICIIDRLVAGSAFCGNGVIEAQEECDLGPYNDDTYDARCYTDCTVPYCGDAITNPGEECDDGNAVPGDGCNSVCQVDLDLVPKARNLIAAVRSQADVTVNMMRGASPLGQENIQFGLQRRNAQFPVHPNVQPVPYQLPLAQLQPLIQTHGPVGDTGPAAVAVIGAGAAAGFGWVRRRKKK